MSSIFIIPCLDLTYGRTQQVCGRYLVHYFVGTPPTCMCTKVHKGDLIFLEVHSFSKERQQFGSYLSFGEECIPVNLGLYIISTMLMVTTSQKPHFKIDNCLENLYADLP